MKERLLIVLAAAVVLTTATPVLSLVGRSSAPLGHSAIALDSGLDGDCHGSGHCGG